MEDVVKDHPLFLVSMIQAILEYYFVFAMANNNFCSLLFYPNRKLNKVIYCGRCCEGTSYIACCTIIHYFLFL